MRLPAGQRRCPRGRHVTVAVLRGFSVHTNRCHEQRSGIGVAEQFDRQIARRAIDHHARHHAPVVEGRRVLILRVFIPAPARDIVGQAWPQRFVRAFFQRGEIDRPGGQNTA